jgi:hypothetical protein
MYTKPPEKDNIYMGRKQPRLTAAPSWISKLKEYNLDHILCLFNHTINIYNVVCVCERGKLFDIVIPLPTQSAISIPQRRKGFQFWLCGFSNCHNTTQSYFLRDMEGNNVAALPMHDTFCSLP